MRAWEVLTEYDPNISDRELKTVIKQRVNIEKDRKLLDRIFQTLEKSTLDERLAGAMEKDADAVKYINDISRMILYLPGSFADKERFISNFNKGFVNIKQLVKPNVINTFDNIFVDDKFVRAVADELMTAHPPQGIGPGEIALAVLSSEIKSLGRSTGAGDLQIGNLAVEVKAKKIEGGRFVNSREAQINREGTKIILTKLGMKSVPRTINIERMVPILNDLQVSRKKPVLKKILLNLFRFYTDIDPIINAMIAGDYKLARKEYLIASFYNYKKMERFDGMLLIDVPKKHTLYFTDANEVLDILHSKMPYLYGPDQEVFPQIKFKI